MAVKKGKISNKIEQALIDMLGTMPIDDITATALCEHAKVNRATFYYHYNSVQDVLTEIQTQVENEFLQWISQSSPADESGMPQNSFYVSFFEFVARNAGICKMLLGAQHRSEFLARAMEAGRTKVISVMSTVYPQCPASKINYYYIFVSNGFIGLLQYWLNSGMKESVAEIAETGERISNIGINYLTSVQSK